MNMSSETKFVIENGKLKEYSGQERNLVIPDTVERIDCMIHSLIYQDAIIEGR